MVNILSFKSQGSEKEHPTKLHRLRAALLQNEVGVILEGRKHCFSNRVVVETTFGASWNTILMAFLKPLQLPRLDPITKA